MHLLLSILLLGATTHFAVEFDVAGMSCGDCATTATRALRQIDGVTRATVDFSSKRGRIEAHRVVSADEIRTALAKLGFEARFATDKPIAPLTPAERAGLDIKIASKGQAFDLRKHLAPGKITIFDFWAEWCGPCHLLTPKLERLVQENPRVALRTIDLKQWDSSAGKQATKEFKAVALPYVRIYGPEGKFIGEVLGNDIGKIKQVIEGIR